MRWIFLIIFLSPLVVTLIMARREGKQRQPGTDENPPDDSPPEADPRFWRDRLKVIIIAGVVFALVTSTIAIGQWITLSPNGNDSAEFEFAILFGAISTFIVPMTLVGFIGTGTRGIRSSAFMAFAIGCCFFLCCMFWGRVAYHVRRHALYAFTERSKPLIAAIKKFQAERGRPPRDLKELVPAYLPEVPHTGFGKQPDYKYKIEGNNNWMLTVFTSVFMDFDNISYQSNPSGRPDSYPFTRMIGEWAFFDD